MIKNQTIKEFRENFSKIFDNKLKENLNSMEIERKVILTICRIIAFLIPVTLVKFTFCPEVVAHNEIIIYLVIFFSITTIVSINIYYAIKYLIKKSFENRIKAKIMPILLTAFNDFHWTNSDLIDEKTLRDSMVLSSDFDYMKTDDNFNGSYKDVPITISEMALSFDTEDDDGFKRTYTFFKGICIQLKPMKNFKGHTIVKPKKHYATKPYEEIKLEDIEFSKIYHIRSNDQIEARYILTPSLMERIKNIKNLFGGKSVSFSFFNQTLIIAIPTTKDLFSLGNLNLPITDQKQYQTFLDEIISIFEIIEELKLYENTGL